MTVFNSVNMINQWEKQLYCYTLLAVGLKYMRLKLLEKFDHCCYFTIIFICHKLTS